MSHVYKPQDIFSFIGYIRALSEPAFKLFKAFEEEFVQKEGEEDPLHVSMYYDFPMSYSDDYNWEGHLQVNFILDTYDQVADVLRRCRKLTDSALEPASSNNDGASKSLSFTNTDVHVSISFTGAKCRYVEVGKKEVPVYELQCDE